MKQCKLFIEEHPKDYTGLPFLSSVMIDNQSYMVVVDNHSENSIQWYNVELLPTDKVIGDFMALVEYWYNHSNHLPLSVFLSKHNLTHKFADAYQFTERNKIIRVVGYIPFFDMCGGPFLGNNGKRGKVKVVTKRVKYVDIANRSPRCKPIKLLDEMVWD